MAADAYGDRKLSDGDRKMAEMKTALPLLFSFPALYAYSITTIRPRTPRRQFVQTAVNK